MPYRTDQKNIRLVFPGDQYRDFKVNTFPRKGEDFTVKGELHTVLHVRLVMSDRGMFDSAYVWCAPKEVDDATDTPKLQVVRK